MYGTIVDKPTANCIFLLFLPFFSGICSSYQDNYKKVILILDCTTGELHRVSELLKVPDLSILLPGAAYDLNGDPGKRYLTTWTAADNRAQTHPIGQKRGLVIYDTLEYLGGTTLLHAEVFQGEAGSSRMGLAFYDTSDLDLPPRTLFLSLPPSWCKVNFVVAGQGSQILVSFGDRDNPWLVTGVLSMKRTIQEDVMDAEETVIAVMDTPNSVTDEDLEIQSSQSRHHFLCGNIR